MIQKVIRYTCDGCHKVVDRTDDVSPADWYKIRIEVQFANYREAVRVEHRIFCETCSLMLVHHLSELRKSNNL